MKTKIILSILFLVLSTNCSVSQNNPDNEIRKKLNGFLKNAAEAYLLGINRPYIEIETEIPEINKYFLNFYPSAGSGYVDLPVYGQYSVGKNLCLLGSIDIYTTSYNIAGKKFTGFGDMYAGLSYRFQNSEMFSNFIQSTVKIPSASFKDQMGSGKFDLHFGFGQSFASGNWLNDLTAGLSILNSADFPSSRTGKIPPAIIHVIDSLKSSYDHSAEPQLNISVSPSYYLNDDLCLEGAASFSRNMKLNYNSLYLSGDLDYTFSKYEIFSGLSFSDYRQINYDESEIFAGAAYNVSDKISFRLQSSLGIHNSTGYFVFGEINLGN